MSQFFYNAVAPTGFYCTDLHGAAIPSTATPISADKYVELRDGLAAGRIVSVSTSGELILQTPRPSPDDLVAKIKAERDRRMQQGGYLVNQHWFHSDPNSRSQQLGLALMGTSLPPGIKWKTMAGDYVEITPDLAAAIVSAAVASDVAIFSHATHLIGVVSEATDITTVDITTGWPQCYRDNIGTT